MGGPGIVAGGHPGLARRLARARAVAILPSRALPHTWRCAGTSARERGRGKTRYPRTDAHAVHHYDRLSHRVHHERLSTSRAGLQTVLAVGDAILVQPMGRAVRKRKAEFPPSAVSELESRI